MEIHNPTQFASFVSSNGLTGLDELFNQVVICIGDYSRQCNCHRQNDKVRIYQNCNKLYSAAAMIAGTRLKGEFLNKTSDRQIAFYSENGTLIAIASR